MSPPSIDIQNEPLLTITESTKSKTLQKRASVSTVWRWINRGCRGVKLETVLLGGRRYTTETALTRFCEQVTAAANGEKPSNRTASQISRAVKKAERDLEANGA